ncbi:MAG: tol-pal system protein YbgF [Hyphomicrobiaceae bacterium]|nr:tol-pal system protein YbgF [Hyphomicrobiaceae bacterium]
MTITQPNTVLAQNDEKALNVRQDIVELNKRVKFLEDQLMDIHVILGTFESLVRNHNRHNERAVLGPKKSLLKTVDPNMSFKFNKSVDNGNKVATFADKTIEIGRTSPSDKVVRQKLPQIPNRETGNSLTAQYESAYNSMLRKDYRSAQSAFTGFLQKYPKSRLAGEAQYWLGETFYMQGHYKSAASTFLRGYKVYPSNPKAPDNLLKLAMSLGRLGQRSSACGFLKEFFVKYPNLSESIRLFARQETRRLRC